MTIIKTEYKEASKRLKGRIVAKFISEEKESKILNNKITIPYNIHLSVEVNHRVAFNVLAVQLMHNNYTMVPNETKDGYLFISEDSGVVPVYPDIDPEKWKCGY